MTFMRSIQNAKKSDRSYRSSRRPFQFVHVSQSGHGLARDGRHYRTKGRYQEDEDQPNFVVVSVNTGGMDHQLKLEVTKQELSTDAGPVNPDQQEEQITCESVVE